MDTNTVLKMRTVCRRFRDGVDLILPKQMKVIAQFNESFFSEPHKLVCPAPNVTCFGFFNNTILKLGTISLVFWEQQIIPQLNVLKFHNTLINVQCLVQLLTGNGKDRIQRLSFKNTQLDSKPMFMKASDAMQPLTKLRKLTLCGPNLLMIGELLIHNCPALESFKLKTVYEKKDVFLMEKLICKLIGPYWTEDMLRRQNHSDWLEDLENVLKTELLGTCKLKQITLNDYYLLHVMKYGSPFTTVLHLIPSKWFIIHYIPLLTSNLFPTLLANVVTRFQYLEELTIPISAKNETEEVNLTKNLKLLTLNIDANNIDCEGRIDSKEIDKYAYKLALKSTKLKILRLQSYNKRLIYVHLTGHLDTLSELHLDHVGINAKTLPQVVPRLKFIQQDNLFKINVPKRQQFETVQEINLRYVPINNRRGKELLSVLDYFNKAKLNLNACIIDTEPLKDRKFVATKCINWP